MGNNLVFWYTFERWDVSFESEAKNKKATLFSSLFLFSLPFAAQADKRI